MNKQIYPKVIKNNKQYDAYCERLMELDTKPAKLSAVEQDEMDLLELLIDHWEAQVFQKKKLDPIQLLEYLMENHNMSRNDLIAILGIQKSALSQILAYKKGLSKEVIRKLAEHFKMSQDAFNQEYPLRLDPPQADAIEKKQQSKVLN